jgi:hypothetical protein
MEAFAAMPYNRASDARPSGGTEKVTDRRIDFAFDGRMVALQEATYFSQIEKRLHAEAIVIVKHQRGGEDEFALCARKRVPLQRWPGARPRFVALTIDQRLPAAAEKHVVLCARVHALEISGREDIACEAWTALLEKFRGARAPVQRSLQQEPRGGEIHFENVGAGWQTGGGKRGPQAEKTERGEKESNPDGFDPRSAT